MYNFFRLILFIFNPERIHNLTVILLKLTKYIPFFNSLLRLNYVVKSSNLERKVLGLKFKNPVGIAAGFDKNAEVYNELADFGFGFIEIGTVTRNAQKGNVKPRLFRLSKDKALINRMGFNNIGVDKVIENLQKKRRNGLIIGGNIGKNTNIDNENAPAEYEKTLSRLYNYVDYFVINVSCPNIDGLQSLQTAEYLEKLLGQLTEFRRYRETYKPMLIKISPDLSFEQIDEMLDVIRTIGIDGIVATNTTTSRNGLKTGAKEIERTGSGGLSGSPLTKRSLEIISYINKKTDGDLPIIGAGGIMTEDDAINMLAAGARLVQVYTGFIYNGPKFAKQINKRILKEYQANTQE
ncbi:MAG: quinone-dependent dihydroorotate dehydrogenase [Prevotellaceae bacterium]|jgi:dihydroorotate dehydrogenase|nr:quinone-dependent dihydroorotate dehydrogenase [Prevotellaceae bacterium]